MKSIATFTAAALMLGTAASAQGMDVSTLSSIDDVNIIGADGNKIGEVEEVLVDDSGAAVAVVAEVGGFLDMGDDDVVIMLDELTFADGEYSTQMTEEQLKELPTWND